MSEQLGRSMWQDTIGAPISEALDASVYTQQKRNFVVSAVAKEASSKIARSYRIHFWKRLNSVMCLQKVYRGYRGRSSYVITRRERTEAAIRLQRLERRRIHMGILVTKIQRAFRLWYVHHVKLPKVRGAYLFRLRSIRKIQHQWRRKMGRRYAITKLQQWWRYRWPVYIFASASSIQYKFRRWRARRFLRATRFARGYLARRRFKSMKLEACRIERCRRIAEDAWLSYENEKAKQNLNTFLTTVDGRKRLNYEIDRQLAKRRSKKKTLENRYLKYKGVAEDATSNQDKNTKEANRINYPNTASTNLSIEYQLDVVEIMYDEFNTDGNQSMDIAEMRALFAQFGIDATIGEQTDLFQLLDEDKSGTVSFDELKSFILTEYYGSKMLSPSLQKITNMLIKKSEDFLTETDQSALEVWSRHILLCQAIRELRIPALQRFRRLYPPRSFCKKCLAPFTTVYWLGLHHSKNECPGMAFGKWCKEDEEMQSDEAGKASIATLEKKFKTPWGKEELEKEIENERNSRQLLFNKLKVAKKELSDIIQNVDANKVIAVAGSSPRKHVEDDLKIIDIDDNESEITPSPTLKKDVTVISHSVNALELKLRRYNAEIVFMECDQDAGGTVDTDELSALLASLGIVMSYQDVEMLVVHLDTDASGELDLEEFAEWYCNNAEDDMTSSVSSAIQVKIALAKMKMKATAATRSITGANDRIRAVYKLRRSEQIKARKNAIMEYRKRFPPSFVAEETGTTETVALAFNSLKEMSEFRENKQAAIEKQQREKRKKQKALHKKKMEMEKAKLAKEKLLLQKEQKAKERKAAIEARRLRRKLCEEKRTQANNDEAKESKHSVVHLEMKESSRDKETTINNETFRNLPMISPLPIVRKKSRRKKGKIEKTEKSIAAATMWHSPTPKEEEEIRQSREFFGNVTYSSIGVSSETKSDKTNVDVWQSHIEKEEADAASDEAVQDMLVFITTTKWGSQQLLDEILAVKTKRKGIFQSNNVFDIRRFEAEESFMKFDVDASGFVDIDEFSHMLKQLGVVVGETEMRFTLSYIDRDNSGLIDRNEFCEWYTTLADETPEDIVWLQKQRKQESQLSLKEKALSTFATRKATFKRHIARVNGSSDILRAKYNLMARARHEARATAILKYREKFPPPTHVLENEFTIGKQKEHVSKDGRKNDTSSIEGLSVAQELGLWSKQEETKIATEAWNRSIVSTTKFLDGTSVGKCQLKDEISKQRKDRKNRFLLTRTKQKFLEAEDIFMQFDQDCQGEIDVDEFSAMLVALNISFTDKEFKNTWKALDADGSNVVQKDEFASWYCDFIDAETKNISRDGSVYERAKLRMMQMKMNAQRQKRDIQGTTDEIRARYILLQKTAEEARRLAIMNFRKFYAPPFKTAEKEWSQVEEDEAGEIGAEAAGSECITFLSSTAWGKKTLLEESAREKKIRKNMPQQLDEGRKRLEAENVFMQFDNDASGFVDRTELESMLAHLGFDVSNVEFNSILGDLDADGNGLIDMNEFVLWYINWVPEKAPLLAEDDPVAVMREQKMKRLRQKIAAIQLKREITGDLDRTRARYRLIQSARKEGHLRGITEYRKSNPPAEGTKAANAQQAKKKTKGGPREVWSQKKEDEAALKGAEDAMSTAADYVDNNISGAAALSLYIERLKGERKSRESVSGIIKAMEQRRWEGEIVFMMFDTDISGSVDWVEFGVLLETIGVHKTTEQLKDLLRELDTDQSGSINMEEFLAWFCAIDTSRDAGVSGIRARAKRRKLTSDKAKVDKMRARYMFLKLARKRGAEEARAEFKSRCRRPDNSKSDNALNIDGNIGKASTLTGIEKQALITREAKRVDDACFAAELQAAQNVLRFFTTPHGKKALHKEISQNQEANAKILLTMDNASKSERAKLLEAEDIFMYNDKSMKGSLQIEEFKDMLKSFGVKLSEEEILLIFSKKDRKDLCDLKQFTEWYKSLGSGNIKQKAKGQLLRTKMKIQLTQRNISGESQTTRAKYKMVQNAKRNARRKVLNIEFERKKKTKIKQMDQGVDVSEEFLVTPDDFNYK